MENISQIIKKLEAIMLQEGDLPVYIYLHELDIEEEAEIALSLTSKQINFLGESVELPKRVTIK